MVAPRSRRDEAELLVHLALEIHASAEPIHGTLGNELGSQRFDGWLELVRLIEDRRARVRDLARTSSGS